MSQKTVSKVLKILPGLYKQNVDRGWWVQERGSQVQVDHCLAGLAGVWGFPIA